jgi:hypothetical protein
MLDYFDLYHLVTCGAQGSAALQRAAPPKQDLGLVGLGPVSHTGKR